MDASVRHCALVNAYAKPVEEVSPLQRYLASLKQQDNRTSYQNK